MDKLYRLIKILLTLILLMALFPQELSAQGMNASAEIRSGDENTSLGEAEVYSKLYGVKIDETLRRFKIQDVARVLQADLSENDVNIFGGLWIEHSPEFKVVVLFTQNASQSLALYRTKEYITKDLSNVLEARTVKISLGELEKTQEELLATLTNSKIQVETEINVYENNIRLAIVEADKTRFDLALQNKSLQLPEYVMVITIPQLGKLESNIYGGLALNACNTAFSVQDIYGVLGRGVTTAGHCGDNDRVLTYQYVVIPRVSRLKTGSYDVEWHTTPGFTVTNQFKAGATDVRRVTAIRSRNDQLINELVCKYGVNTGYTCGHISSKNVNGNVIPPLAATFIRVNNDIPAYPNLSESGDSGAPWFSGNTAYGIHHGDGGSDPNDATYMAINYVDGLGVSVVLNPVFGDVPWDYWAWQDIERLYNSHITGGCSTNPLNYCPNNTVSRAEMAVFLLRGIHGSSYAPPSVGAGTGFSDVPITYWAAAWIKQLAAEGITGGCGNNNYCPDSPATHAQMAVFLLRSKYTSAYTPPAVGSSTGFSDVPTTYWAAAWIKQVAAEYISNGAYGCSYGYYCPESNVTRAEMAGLLVRTFYLP